MRNIQIARLILLLITSLLLVVGCNNTQEDIGEEMPEDFNFSLMYGRYGKNQVNTFRNIVVKDLVEDDN